MLKLIVQVMCGMKFSYNWLKELVAFKESPEELAEILTLRAFEVESVEKSGDDFALDIKVFANRLTDAAGHLGMAREIAFILGLKFKEPKNKFNTGKSAPGFIPKISINPPTL